MLEVEISLHTDTYKYLLNQATPRLLQVITETRKAEISRYERENTEMEFNQSLHT